MASQTLDTPSSSPIFSVPDGFWPGFVDELWGKRPAVFKRPFRGELASSDEVLAALQTLAGRLRQGDERIAYRMNVRGTPTRAPEAFLPEASDSSFAGFVQRLRARESDFGLIVNTFQALHEDIWRRSLHFLSGLYARVGIPFGGALINLFTGNYRESFLGFHKDDQDVFTFVIEGHKRLLAWPFETFRDLAGLTDNRGSARRRSRRGCASGSAGSSGGRSDSPRSPR